MGSLSTSGRFASWFNVVLVLVERVWFCFVWVSGWGLFRSSLGFASCWFAGWFWVGFMLA